MLGERQQISMPALDDYTTRKNWLLAAGRMPETERCAWVGARGLAFLADRREQSCHVQYPDFFTANIEQALSEQTARIRELVIHVTWFSDGEWAEQDLGDINLSAGLDLVNVFCRNGIHWCWLEQALLYWWITDSKISNIMPENQLGEASLCKMDVLTLEKQTIWQGDLTRTILLQSCGEEVGKQRENTAATLPGKWKENFIFHIMPEQGWMQMAVKISDWLKLAKSLKKAGRICGQNNGSLLCLGTAFPVRNKRTLSDAYRE